MPEKWWKVYKYRLVAKELIHEAEQNKISKEICCLILDCHLRTWQRWEDVLDDSPKVKRARPANALTEEEEQVILDTINRCDLVDCAPKIIPAKLADEGIFLASAATIYRILKKHQIPNRKRQADNRNKHRPPHLRAVEPNKVWTWDITYLKTHIHGVFLYLYVAIDIFSRKAIGYEVHNVESSEIASTFIERCYKSEGVKQNELYLHSDNGAPMKGIFLLSKLQQLGIKSTYSRPGVSDDNPFSEALFKTTKYAITYPKEGFASIDSAEAWINKFFNWYNNDHLHSGINFITPNDKHQGNDIEILNKRHTIYEKAKKEKPIRWSKKTKNWKPSGPVDLNPQNISS